MSNTANVAILEVLASKICHDLISPIGAINNGLEILEEMGADGAEDVIGLVSFSAQQASAKLQAYRMAYGAGGSDSNLKPEDVHAAIEDYIGTEKKFTQDWDPHGSVNFEDRPKAYCKMLTAAILLIVEALPKGGTISLEGDEATGIVTLTGTGENASLRDYVEEALSGLLPYQDVEPRLVHAYITGLLAQHYGYTLEFTGNGDGQVTLQININSQ